MNFIKLTEDQLNINDIYSKVVAQSTGAVSLFVGTTRDHFEDKKVLIF
jgi:molybdopterin synthase catalytic subunit